MKSFLIFIVVLGLFIYALKISGTPENTPSKLPPPGPAITSTALSLNHMDGINYSVKTLPNSTMDYLKTRSEYKNFLDRKLVIYPSGANCPYARAFERAINNLRTTYEGKYNYYAIDFSGGTVRKTFEKMEDAQADIDFFNTCQDFCIVNPYNNQIFAISGVGTEEANRLGEIFAQLENW